MCGYVNDCDDDDDDSGYIVALCIVLAIVTLALWDQ